MVFSDVRRRSAVEKNTTPAATIEANTYSSLNPARVNFFSEQTGLVMHSESKWQQQWTEFKDNNSVAKGTPIDSIVYLLILQLSLGFE